MDRVNEIGEFILQEFAERASKDYSPKALFGFDASIQLTRDGTDKRRAQTNSGTLATRFKYKSRGLCECGKPRAGNRKSCTECLARHKAKRAAKKAKK